MAEEGQGGGISKTIVEVYVETDSESEPYSSSEGDEGSEATLTAQEGATEEEPDLNQESSHHEEARVIPSEIVPSQLSPPAIIASSAIAPGESPFPGLLDQESGFDLYDPESAELAVSPPDMEPNEMEVDVEVETNDIFSSGYMPIGQSTEPESRSRSHSPDIHSSTITTDQSLLVPQPKRDTSPVLKLDIEAPLFIGLSQPPDTDPSKLYCLCQEPATFSMIPCHKCQNWFHGECVGLTRQKAATVKQFFCPLCIDKDPSLVTTFESRAEREAAMMKRERSQQQLPSWGQPKGGSRKSGKKHSRRCGECSGCLTVIDCRKCRFCRDMPKYGGPGRQRQKCIKRQCLRFSRILYTEDPLHNKAAVMQDEMVAELKAAGSGLPPPLPVDPSGLEAAAAPMRESGVTDAAGREGSTGVVWSQALEGFEDLAATPRAAALKQMAPAVSSAAKKKPVSGGQGGTPSTSAKRGRVGGKAGGGGKGKRRPGRPAGSGGGSKSGGAKKPTRTRLSFSDFDGVAQLSSGRSRRPLSILGGLFRDEVHTPQQCLGPECVFAARPHSKYCSEECGVNLAMKRIKTLFPERRKLVKMEKEEAIATKKNKEKLEQLNNEQEGIKHRLEELDRQTLAIDRHIGKLSSVAPISVAESLEADSDDLTIHCATCSMPVMLKKALTHFERCFNKTEGQVSFGSIVRNEGTNIFCDKYDASQKTYCKRLRVLCPEHTKEPKISPDDVCGCPFDPDFPAKVQTSKKFCRQPKKSCALHYCWEKLRRAEIDQEKLNLFLKLEEVSEQIRLHQWQIEHRESFLAVMLHHTVAHEEEGGGASLSDGVISDMIVEPFRA